jgi:asparagine synthase (glutamine-hydrolysing)
MCGIFGIWNIEKKSVNVDELIEATNRIRHRGPDDEGYLLIDNNNKPHSCGGKDTDPRLELPSVISKKDQSFYLAFGFRRLSILDLSPSGHQPMSSPDKRFWIVFNGEIYNYVELREELKSFGFRFSGCSDTEVILAAYQKWGKECLFRFNGMWALAIWDQKFRSLFLARDRFGIKPLYYVWKDRSFLFSSEIKSFIGNFGLSFDPDQEAIYDYLTRGIKPDPKNGKTFFRKISSLEPGKALIITNEGVSPFSYWNLPQKDDSFRGTLDEASSEYQSMLINSINIRLRSNVPVGTCLSGGTDSSSIVCCINKLMKVKGMPLNQIGLNQRTFSAVYNEEGPFNEKKYIEQISNYTHADSSLVYPTANRLVNDIDQLMWHQEEPFNDTGVFSQWCVMKQVREKDVIVVLDGQGADEALGGYRPFHLHLKNLLADKKWKTVINETRGINQNTNESGWMYLVMALALNSCNLISKVTNRVLFNKRTDLSMLENDFVRMNSKREEAAYEKDLSNKDLLDDRLRNEFESSLPHLLRYEDRNAMAFGVEARMPFLDYRLVEYSFSRLQSWRIYNGWTKYILRHAMSSIVPREIVWRKDKIGFGTPENAWLKEWLQSENSLLNDFTLGYEYINLPKLKSSINEWFYDNIEIRSMFRLISIVQWLKTWESMR